MRIKIYGRIKSVQTKSAGFSYNLIYIELRENSFWKEGCILCSINTGVFETRITPEGIGGVPLTKEYVRIFNRKRSYSMQMSEYEKR